MKKILPIIYLIILLLLAISSSLISLVNDPKSIFLLEIATDLIFVSGVILFIAKIQTKLWGIPLFLACVAEIYLLIIDQRIDMLVALGWGIILLPAIYFHIRVAGFIQTDNNMQGQNA